MALEAVIQKNIIDYLKKVKQCTAENVTGCASQKGRPDINACWKGRSFRIEVKSPDNGYMPTELQIANLKRWARAGALCIVAWSVEEVKNIVEHDGYNNPDFTGWYITKSGKVYKGGHTDG